MTALIVIGGVAVLAGAIIWGLSARAFEAATLSDQYSTALNGFSVGAGVWNAQLGIGIGIAILVIGVLMLVAALVLKAARAR